MSQEVFKKFRKFTKKELVEVIHLQTLREIGRQIGVKSPTAKNKKTLADCILGIQNGTIIPLPPSKRGAPPKIKIDVSQYYENEDDFEQFIEAPAPNVRTTVCDHEEKEFTITGIFEPHSKGYGFIRTNSQIELQKDVYVSTGDIRKYNLKSGDLITAKAKFARGVDESAAMQQIITLNEEDPETFAKRKRFDELTPYYPTERITLEREDKTDDLAIRAIDLFAPVGKGQRGLIVAPPKTGKTTIMKRIAQSIEKNHPEIKLIILLIDERPEEVTDMQRSVKADVMASTFDEGAEHHIRLAEYVINRAKRLVETEHDVVILMDSITKLTRAYNTTVVSSGKTLSGGIDPVALQPPKRFFGTARNIENGGSLTILSTALVDTGSRMDDVIYEEFKGTGNMELHLSRDLSERRIFPAIDFYKSGTRRDELLLSKEQLDAVFKTRKILSEREDATESLLEMMKKTKDNLDFVVKMDAWIKLYEK